MCPIIVSGTSTPVGTLQSLLPTTMPLSERLSAGSTARVSPCGSVGSTVALLELEEALEFALELEELDVLEELDDELDDPLLEEIDEVDELDEAVEPESLLSSPPQAVSAVSVVAPMIRAIGRSFKANIRTLASFFLDDWRRIRRPL
ncbi:MAG: hypothetical protein QM803_19380 [Rhodocyclaceae bacterium]